MSWGDFGKEFLAFNAKLVGAGMVILVAVELGGDLLRGDDDGPPAARDAQSPPTRKAPSADASSTSEPFAGRADLAVAVSMLDARRGQRVQGVVEIAASTPVRASALYLAQPQRLDLILRYPPGGAPPRTSWVELKLSIPQYAGVGSYPIRTFKGGVDAWAFARQAVLHVFAPDTGITGLAGLRGTQEQFTNSHHWTRDGRTQAFDDIGGAIHVLKVGNGRLVAEISAVLYAISHVAPGFAGYGEREGRASISGRVEFATLNELPQ